MERMARKPAVAGRFYTGNKEKLQAELKGYLQERGEKERAIGIISPHAGYMYSGAVAGAVYGVVKVPKRVVILGPNHHGLGSRAALYPWGEWLTPLGSAVIDSDFGSLLKRHASFVRDDPEAHAFEHSLEVQVPFLQQIRPDVEIVPLCLSFSDYASCALLGTAIAAAVREGVGDTLIVASSDMTHYEPAESARTRDQSAIAQILALNPEGLLSVCIRNGITMCGVIPSTVMLVAAKALGATQAKLLRYATSGDVSGDNSSVVGYAAIAVS